MQKAQTQSGTPTSCSAINRYQLFLEVNGFFIYLYVLADLFLIYVLVFALRGKGVVENHKVQKATLTLAFMRWSTCNLCIYLQSHGSLAIRVGALIFSAGALIYFSLELVAFAEVRPSSPCFHASLGANVGLALIFVGLQTYLVFVYPRLNIDINKAVDRFGLMHLVATNIILWLRTLMKESLHEIAESEEDAHAEGEEHLVSGGRKEI